MPAIAIGAANAEEVDFALVALSVAESARFSTSPLAGTGCVGRRTTDRLDFVFATRSLADFDHAFFLFANNFFYTFAILYVVACGFLTFPAVAPLLRDIFAIRVDRAGVRRNKGTN